MSEQVPQIFTDYERVCKELGSEGGYFFLNGSKPLRVVVQELTKTTVENYIFSWMPLIDSGFKMTENEAANRKGFALFERATRAILRNERPPQCCRHCGRQARPSRNVVWLG